MNSKATRAALLTSITSLVLCFTMLMGTSLAWFVDRVENTNNRIEAGNLEVDLVMYNSATQNYVSIANLDNDVNLFTLAGSDGAFWSPGISKTVYFGVRNTGTIPVKYKAKVIVSDGGLAGALRYTISENVGAGALTEEEITGSSKMGSLKTPEIQITDEFYELMPVVGDPMNPEEPGETDYYALNVTMIGNADYETYKNKSVSITIAVEATQLNYDEDADTDNPEDTSVVEAELPETLSATSWRMKAELEDFSFLETEEDKESEYIFPEETVISDGETEYPLSTFSVASIGDAKLLIAELLEETETEAVSDGEETATDGDSSDDTEEQNVFVYLQMPVVGEEEEAEETSGTEENSGEATGTETESDISGWYLVDYEELQKLLSSQEADITALFTSENIITDEEKLPIVTFPESEEAVLENKDFIKWLVSSAEAYVKDSTLS